MLRDAGGTSRPIRWAGRWAGPGQTLIEHGFRTGGTTLEEAEARLCVFSQDDLAALLADHPSIALLDPTGLVTLVVRA